MMLLEIWSDIACPWCYIGKRRLARALDAFAHRDELEVVWHSFELDPGAPRRRPEPAAEHLARKYGVPLAQAQAMNARLAALGAEEGLTFHMDRVQLGNTFDAHRLVHLAAAAGLRDAMLDRLFSAYFSEGAPLGDADVLAGLAAEAGVPRADAQRALASEAFADDVRADEARASSLGIDGVPFFAIDERYGLSGAQPPDVLVRALDQAWREHRVSPEPPADVCADGSCAR